jgi:hypothetical protein
VTGDAFDQWYLGCDAIRQFEASVKPSRMPSVSTSAGGNAEEYR